MKACVGQDVSASLLKAYQTVKAASKTLVVKGVPTEVPKKDFKEFLDINKRIYAKDERLTSKENDRVLQMFTLEIKDEAKAEALISQKSNLSHHRYNHRWRIFGPQFQYGSARIAKISTIRQKQVSLKPNVLSVWRAIITKDALIERKSSQNAPTVKGHMLLPTKGVQRTKASI